jgi:hypothetical protein
MVRLTVFISALVAMGTYRLRICRNLEGGASIGGHA